MARTTSALASERWPEQLVASQWFDRLSPSVSEVPERRLLVAVLADAIRCLQDGSDRERNEVMAWLRSEHVNARLSFRWLCEGLGLEVIPLVRRLLALVGDTTRVSRRRVHAGGAMRIGHRTRKAAGAVEQPIDPAPVSSPA